jgi:hypothetical protein
VRPHRPNFFNTKVQGLKGSKIENNRWIAFLWTFDPLNLCVEKNLAYKSHAVEKRYKIIQSPPASIVSAASFKGEELAREAIASAFGFPLATGTAAAQTLPLPTSLQGTTVKIIDRAGIERLAPLFFVSPSQVNCLIPAVMPLGEAEMSITGGDGNVSSEKVRISPTSPGLFSADSTGGRKIRQHRSNSCEIIFLAEKGRELAVVVLPTGLRRKPRRPGCGLALVGFIFNADDGSRNSASAPLSATMPPAPRDRKSNRESSPAASKLKGRSR